MRRAQREWESSDYMAGILAELEQAGLIVRTGDFRPGALGRLEPTYVTAVSLGLLSEEEAERRLKLIENTHDRA
jgi:hypothetical protein